MELPEIVVVIVGRVALRAAHQSSADRQPTDPSSPTTIVGLDGGVSSLINPGCAWLAADARAFGHSPGEQGTNAPGTTSETSRRLKVSLVAITVSVSVARPNRSKVWED